MDNTIRCDCCGWTVSQDALKRREPRPDVHPGAAIVTLKGHERHWVTWPPKEKS